VGFSSLLIKFSKFLLNSKKYQDTKQFFRDLMENESYKYKKHFDIFMITLVLSSVFILIYDVQNEVKGFFYYYDIYFVTTIFAIEYLIRVWIASDMSRVAINEYEESLFLNRKFRVWEVTKKNVKGKLNYMTTPFAIIDLLAILPAYRPLRVLRIFVLFRLFKVLRYTKSVNSFLDILKTKKFEITTLLMLVAFVTFVGGAIMYVFESEHNENIGNFFDAIYWSFITISTVGYGDISPKSDEARALTLFLILAGIGFLSFTTSIISSAFTERLEELKANRVELEIDKIDSYYIICGYSNISKLISAELKKSNKRVVVVSTNQEHITEANLDGHLTYKYDITQKDVLKRFSLKKIIGFFVLYNDDIVNTFLILSIRSYTKDSKIIAISNSESNMEKMKIAGANHVLNPTKVSALLTAEYISNPITFTAIEAILYGKRNAIVDEIEVLPKSFLENKSINEIDFDSYKLILIGVMKRNSYKMVNKAFDVDDKEFYFNPDFELKIERGDVLIVMGYGISIDHFKNLLRDSI
jgi:voltage-gated potassium channel